MVARTPPAPGFCASVAASVGAIRVGEMAPIPMQRLADSR